jgi:GMP synthase (glutamine-hydrolysing)
LVTYRQQSRRSPFRFRRLSQRRQARALWPDWLKPGSPNRPCSSATESQALICACAASLTVAAGLASAQQTNARSREAALRDTGAHSAAPCEDRGVRCLVLQHIACEPPGVFEDVLRERGAALIRVELDEGEPLPSSLDGIDAIVAMGGPMSVNDDAELPWVADEKTFIRAAVTAGTPYFGVCLGAQLLAASLGARVFQGPAPEVGVLPVSLTDEGRADPVFAGLPREFATLQWHGDTFDLPEAAVLLAGSTSYPNQAFRVGPAYGVQFHLEVSASIAAEWASVPAYADALEQTQGADALARLLADFEQHRAAMEERARALLTSWLETAVGAGRGSPAAGGARR